MRLGVYVLLDLETLACMIFFPSTPRVLFTKLGQALNCVVFQTNLEVHIKKIGTVQVPSAETGDIISIQICFGT
jgi:hypothetical protein